MGEYDPGLPVDMDAIDAMAGSATEGAGKLEDKLREAEKGLVNHLESRSARFQQGSSEAKALPYGA